MRARETISRLAGFAERGPGSDAERRAAGWLARELEDPVRDVRLEPFWCRPNWALAHAWHVALALAGSLIAVGSPWVGGALILVALLSVIADDRFGHSLGRRLTPERASQNVVSAPASGPAADQMQLIITANYDAGRTGIAYRPALRRAAARLRRATGGSAPGWLAWLTLALAWLLITAVLRIAGSKGTAIGIAQLPPTAALVLGLALLVELGSASFGPAAGDNASGTAVAVVIARALATAAPRRLAVNLVLAGAGEGPGIGLKHYLRQRRRTLNRRNTMVLGIAACATGNLCWWASDGALVPVAYDARIRLLCADLAATEPELGASPHRGRGATPALPARAAKLPAITIGCLDEHGLVPHSHQRSDTPATVSEDATGTAVEFGLILIDAIDAHFHQLRGAAHPAPTPA